MCCTRVLSVFLFLQSSFILTYTSLYCILQTEVYFILKGIPQCEAPTRRHHHPRCSHAPNNPPLNRMQHHPQARHSGTSSTHVSLLIRLVPNGNRKDKQTTQAPKGSKRGCVDLLYTCAKAAGMDAPGHRLAT